MKDLYIVINEKKDGTFYGECPLIKGYRHEGSSLTEVKQNMLEVVRLYLENNMSLMDNVKGVNYENINQGFKSSIVPKW